MQWYSQKKKEGARAAFTPSTDYFNKVLHAILRILRYGTWLAMERSGMSLVSIAPLKRIAQEVMPRFYLLEKYLFNNISNLRRMLLHLSWVPVIFIYAVFAQFFFLYANVEQGHAGFSRTSSFSYHAFTFLLHELLYWCFQTLFSAVHPLVAQRDTNLMV